MIAYAAERRYDTGEIGLQARAQSLNQFAGEARSH